MVYTGIGSRETPFMILNLMTEIGMYLGRAGIILRSGGADGADNFFESGCNFSRGPKEIYLPSDYFNGRKANGKDTISINDPSIRIKKAYDISEMTFNSRNLPVKWWSLRPFTKSLMIRNVFQILGVDLESPTDLVICWTKDGLNSGGTGQALTLAEKYSIPILNLQKEEARKTIQNALKTMTPEEFIASTKHKEE